MAHAASSAYVMGHNDRERRRLALQASIINPFTEQLLRRAGITTGMRVLDLGCGIGEVSMIAARLVGRYGEVIGLDIDDAALAIAREQARQQGQSHVNFAHTDLAHYQAEVPFDAVVGRHILIHMRDPLNVLQHAFRSLHTGGVAVFQEYDFSVVHPAYPPAPVLSKALAIFHDLFCQPGSIPLGTGIYHLLVEAGFSHPDCRAEYPLDGGPESPFYEWLAEALRSILPKAAELGLVDPDAIDIDTLADRLREETVARKGAIIAPMMVAAFARKR